MEKIINIMLVEDHTLIRAGIRTLFEETDGYKVIAEAQCAKEAIEKSEKSCPDVILLDLSLPDKSGLKVLKHLQDKGFDGKIIILSSYSDFENVNTAFSLGINTYVVKDISTEMLLFIVKTVYDGAMWLDPKIIPILRDKTEKIIPQKQTSRASFRNSHANLTQREYEVLKLIVDGKSNNDIAQLLCISEHTAKAHVCNIIQKLVVDDRTQAAVKALKEGIV